MQTFRGAIERITKKGRHDSNYDGSVTPRTEGVMVWKDMATEPTTGRWRTRWVHVSFYRKISLKLVTDYRKVAGVTTTLAGCLFLFAMSSG